MRAVYKTAVAALLVLVLLARQFLVGFRFQNNENDAATQDIAAAIGDGHSVKSPATRNEEDPVTFLGMHLDYFPDSSTPRSSSVVHCVGENFLPKLSTGYRSCQFRHLCWDIQTEEFILVRSPQAQKTERLLKQISSYARTSAGFHNTTVSLAGTNEAALRSQGNNNDMGWFPKTVSLGEAESGFYRLPKDVAVIPVRLPRDGTLQPREMVFDFLLPIYNLVAMFGLQDKSLLLANVGPSSSSCDETCYSEVLPYIALLTNQRDSGDGRKTRILFAKHGLMTTTTKDNLQSTHVCAAFGAAGIGGLTDHGIHKKSHGERRKDYAFVQNSGRGPLLFGFRRFLLHNTDPQLAARTYRHRLPLVVTVAPSQSKKSGLQDFSQQIRSIRRRFPSSLVTVRSCNATGLSLPQQMEIATKSHVYVSVMGNGAVPALFLPRGASLVLYYNDHDEFVSATKREEAFPIRLDWDLWNNLSHLRVWWLPLKSKDSSGGTQQLLDFLQAEIDSLVEEENQEKASTHTTPAEGTFNGLPVRFVDRQHPTKSSAHCVGHDFQQGAHALRSCQYRHLCLDLASIPRAFSLVNHTTNSSSDLDATVSLGQTIRFSEDNAWSPRLLSSDSASRGFYELANDVVWIPFYAEQPNIHNPGHLLWDYFLPFFNLLAMFGLEEKQVLVGNVDDRCTAEENGPCWKLLHKFLPLMGVDPTTFSNAANSQLRVKGERRSDLVCARRAVAGIGMLTDHGWNRHGQRIEDYRDSHNSGRGPLFYRFRNFVVKNMGIQEEASSSPPYKVVFSTLSSKNPSRRLGFEKQIEALRSSFATSNDEVVVEQHVLAELTLDQQVQLATRTSVFISVVGGSACTATFLPRGSSVILFFNDVNEFADHAPRKDFPSFIDWDFWNNASYLRVHWLPIRTMDQEIDVQVLTEMVRSELATLKAVE